MELYVMRDKAVGFLRKYRYVVVILVIGLVLMLIPDMQSASEAPAVPTEASENVDIVADLEEILERISGAGKVRVLVTCSAGEKTLYQMDETNTKSESGSNYDKETVIVSGENRSEQGLITQVLAPEYLGAIVVCQGATDPQVRLAVTEAVSAATGLGADCIVVLKMN